MIPQKSIVRFHVLFFPPGNPLQTAKSNVCSHLTSTPDAGSQGQPVRQGYCFLSTAIRPSRTANQTLHTFCNLRAAQVWLREHFTTTQLLQVVQDSVLGQCPESVQPGQAFSWVLIDAGGPTGLLEQTLTQNIVSTAVGQISDSVTWKKSTEPYAIFSLSFRVDRLLRRCKLYS